MISLRSLSQSATLSVGALLNSFLGLIFYIWVGRSLTVEGFGYFSFLFGIGVLAAELGDMGINPAIIRFGNKEGFKAVFTIATLQKLAVGIFLIVAALVAQLFYPENFLVSALVGWFLLLLYLPLQSFLAKQRYFLYVFTNIFGNVTRLAVIYLFITWQILSVETALGAVLIANIAALILGLGILIIIERGLPFALSNFRLMLKQIIGFSSWIGVSFGVSALAAKLDQPLVFSLAGAQAAGLYSSAQRLSSVLPQIAGAVDGVFSPKVAQTGKEQAQKHFFEYLFLAVFLAVALLVAIPFTQLALTLVFGSQYQAAAPLLQLFLLGMAAFFLTGPFSSMVIYHYGQSKFHFLSSVIQLVVGVAVMLALIPQFGAMGAAIAFIVVNVLNLALFASFFILLSRRKE